MAKENADKKRAVVLLSGGMDSAALLAYACRHGYQCFALTFHYGQKHAIEIEAAKKTAESLGVAQHLILDVNLREFAGSALTNGLVVPKGRGLLEITSEIPVTYVPARNTIFLGLALGWAESLGARHIFIGVNELDYGGYPDCRPAFIEQFERLANVATKAGVTGSHFRVHAPFVKKSKTEILRRGIALGVDFSLTHSCFDPNEKGKACGECDACRLRLQAFREIGSRDPVRYVPATSK